MPNLPPQADALYASLLALDRVLLSSVKVAWSGLDLRHLQESFVQEFVPQVLPKVVVSQTTAAALGAKSVSRVAARAPIPVSVPSLPDLPPLPDLPLPQVNASAFAGVASDGRELTRLLARPLIETYVNLDNGMPRGSAMRAGFDSMDQILTTQVQDAARVASSVAMVADRTVTYYVRAVEPGACGRCIVLAGRKYKWSKAFLRHPRCRCLNVAETEDVSAPSVQELYDGMTPKERERAFTVAGAQAIEHGADIGKVVNARRGMSTTQFNNQSLLTTTSGARPGQIRLMPESILQLSAGDRDLAVDLLRRNGFLR